MWTVVVDTGFLSMTRIAGWVTLGRARARVLLAWRRAGLDWTDDAGDDRLRDLAAVGLVTSVLFAGLDRAGVEGLAMGIALGIGNPPLVPTASSDAAPVSGV